MGASVVETAVPRAERLRVSAVWYYAPAEVARAVSRAVSVAHGEDAIRVLSLERVVEEGWDDRLAA